MSDGALQSCRHAAVKGRSSRMAQAIVHDLPFQRVAKAVPLSGLFQRAVLQARVEGIEQARFREIAGGTLR